jgi:hypothetical protein
MTQGRGLGPVLLTTHRAAVPGADPVLRYVDEVIGGAVAVPNRTE